MPDGDPIQELARTETLRPDLGRANHTDDGSPSEGSGTGTDAQNGPSRRRPGVRGRKGEVIQIESGCRASAASAEIGPAMAVKGLITQDRPP
jgi:hypothetical protein